ncbi:tetrahydromethanopterin S-methyltransferase subunit G [Methanothrix sp.]|uniref:tetrahydromethanopterin S-methyltransferase subunit MtrG n=1 Tax=Methanothrix sp. TaxID=90426 RepID=UPI002352B49E|nr:tetrahydromethanopterin S-methyltransferase subunit G [Methanothrix sp.]
MPEHMPEDTKPVVPVAVVDPDQLRDVMARLEKIEEKIEFYSSEKYMRAGKSIGRDLGMAYGICAGLILVLAWRVPHMLHWHHVLCQA